MYYLRSTYASTQPTQRCNPRTRRSAPCAAKKIKSSKNEGSDAYVQAQSQMLSALSHKSVAQKKSEKNDKETGVWEHSEQASTAPVDVQVVRKGKGKKRASPTQLTGSLYSHPLIYDLAFGYRNYEEEADFLFDMYEDVKGQEPKSFLELGCGPALHSMEMAESELEVYCLDSEAKMLEYAKELAAEDNLTMTTIEADMRDFRLPRDEGVDLAACMIGTFQDLLTNEDALAALSCAHQAIKPGGMLVVEMNHPAMLFDGSLVTTGDTWTVDSEEAKVEVMWGHEGDEFDPMTQVLTKTIEVEIMKTGGGWEKLNDTVDRREYTFQELKLLAEIKGFKVIRVYGDFDLGNEIGDITDDEFQEPNSDYQRPASAPKQEPEDPFRMILVLERI